ncbi:MAG: hypothetical protein ABWW66_06825 [Archaeoglobaceae archaeon]
MAKFRMFVEDKYGPEFFEKLIDRIKEVGLIPEDIIVKPSKPPADCNPKIDRAIKSALSFGYDRVILVIDGDGNPEEKQKRAESHIPPEFKDRVDVIVFEYEAEEWICESLGIRYSSYTKPSKALNDWLRNKEGKKYHKRDLPKFVSKLDLALLNRNDRTFKNLIKLLNIKTKRS